MTPEQLAFIVALARKRLAEIEAAKKLAESYAAKR